MDGSAPAPFPLNGYMNEARIYKRALSWAEVWQLYANGRNLNFGLIQSRRLGLNAAAAFKAAWAVRSNQIFDGMAT
jgi:hypothetical protein